MPDTHRMDPPRRTAVANALAPWLLAAGLALLPTAALHAQAFGEVQSPPEQVDARPHVFAEPSTDSILVGYTLYTNPDGTVMYLPRREIDIGGGTLRPVSFTPLRAHETDSHLVCRLLL